MKSCFLVIVHAVRRVEIPGTGIDKIGDVRFTDHYRPFYTEAYSEAAAKEIGSEHFDLFFDRNNGYSKKEILAYYEHKLRAPDYIYREIREDVKKEQEVALQDLVFTFLDRSQAQYSTSLSFVLSKKNLKSNEDSWKASAEFMLRPVQKELEDELNPFREFFRGNFNGQLLACLTEYFRIMDVGPDPEKAIAKPA
ncbi:MAG TPA: hypothetical protein VHQ41_02475 [Patescibacteria group bacterium]|jgi:hypothetical protein|nr:hypothetical protein [Patescibacteria group bacterium]